MKKNKERDCKCPECGGYGCPDDRDFNEDEGNGTGYMDVDYTCEDCRSHWVAHYKTIFMGNEDVVTCRELTFIEHDVLILCKECKSPIRYSNSEYTFELDMEGTIEEIKGKKSKTVKVFCSKNKNHRLSKEVIEEVKLLVERETEEE
jgi:hypothetical protein